MNERSDNDDPRDAHLLAALRHAPDRDARPPREVSERILSAAHAAVRPARAATVPWWQTLSAWLMRPQVAASFGTLAVASLVGVMWSTREPPVAEFVPPQAAAEQAAATSAVTAPATAPSELGSERDLLAQTFPATLTPKPEAAPHQAKEKKAPVAKADARPTPAASPAPIAESGADGRVAATPAAAAPAARLEEARAADAAVSADNAKASRSREATASMPALESSARQTLALGGNAAATTDPLTRIDALLAGGNATWSSAGRTMPHGPVQAAWWAQLRQATGAAWQSAPSRGADAAYASSALSLMVAGQGIASIDIAADSVWWCAADRSACWRAPISAAQREAWIAEVARW